MTDYTETELSGAKAKNARAYAHKLIGPTCARNLRGYHVYNDNGSSYEWNIASVDGRLDIRVSRCEHPAEVGKPRWSSVQLADVPNYVLADILRVAANQYMGPTI